MVKKVILILGMHRSGTSAVTRLMNMLGAGLPKTMLGQNDGNESGHWESKAIIDQHDEMLSELESGWQDWRIIDPKVISGKTRTQIIQDMANMAKAEHAGQEVSVIKEPRMCRFAPFYYEALEKNKAEVFTIVAMRNPLDVAASLTKRDGLSNDHGLLMWLTHMLEAEAASRGRPRVFCEYEALLKSPLPEIKRIAEAIPFDMPYSPKEVSGPVKNFISKDKRRHKSSAEDVFLHPLGKGWLAESFQAFQVLRKNPNNEAALSVLDAVRASYYPAIPFLYASQNAYKGIELHLNAALAEQQQHFKDTQASNLANQEQAELTHQAEKNEIAAKFESAAEIAEQHHRDELKRLIEEKDSEAAQDSAVLETTKTALETSKTALATTKTAMAKVETKLASREAALTAAKQTQADLDKEIHFMRAEFAEILSEQEADQKSSSAKIAALEDAAMEKDAQHEADKALLQARYHADIQAQTSAKQEAQSALEAVLGSTSWRMTGALRSILNRLRGKKPLTLPQEERAKRLTYSREDTGVEDI